MVNINGSSVLSLNNSYIHIQLIATDRCEFHNYVLKVYQGRITISGIHTFFLKNPKVNTNGEAYISKLYPGNIMLLKKTGATGHDLRITGIIMFEAEYSDYYIFLNKLSFDGKYARIPPIIRFNEWEITVKALPYIAIALVIFLAQLYIIKGIDYKRVSKRPQI